MLMPGLSVTLIGLAIAVAGIVMHRPVPPTLLRGLIGAWAGFLTFGLVGLVLDVVLGNGTFVAFLGHLGAAVTAAIVVARGSRPAAQRPS
jgi:hypothetical protein